ncbi:MAG: hypothetical protein JWR38_5166 [Mucilaginibacter sp.]|nr:hypothetical protein [Mucilaginibacter sp.]
MAKTYWINEPYTLTIYPVRVLRLLSIVYFIGFTALGIYLYMSKVMDSTYLLLIFEGLIVFICLILFGIGERKVIFDGSNQQMYTKMFGLTTSSTPFDQIAAVTPYQVMGATSYRVFTKKNRHGKGIPISGGYTKQTNANLIDYQQEVLPRLNELVFASRPPEVKQAIYEFRFFKEEGGVYTITKNKIGGLVIGILLCALTIYALFHPEFMSDEVSYKRILVTYFPLLIGLVLIGACFTSTSFDKNRRQIIVSYPGGIIRKEYSFDDFIRFQIVRKSTNFVYSGTEVKALLNIPNKGKTRELFLRNFTGTKKIERFIDEASTILGI